MKPYMTVREAFRGLPEPTETGEAWIAPEDVFVVERLARPSDEDFVEHPSGLLVPNERRRPPVGLDLFSGCGGFSLGMEMGGVDVVAAAEWDPICVLTYLLNLGHLNGSAVLHGEEKDQAKLHARIKRGQQHRERALKKAGHVVTDEILPGDPHWVGSGWRYSQATCVDPGVAELGCRAIYHGDITQLTGEALEELLSYAGVEHVDVIFGGPPCQGLSVANPKACLEDPRNACLWEFLRVVEELEPECFIIENVPPLLTVAKGALYQALKERANAAGYNVVANVLNAADYGVPQNRRRAIVVGTKGTQWYQYPMPTHWPVGSVVEDEDKEWDMREIFHRKKKPKAKVRFDAETHTFETEEPEEPEDEPAPEPPRQGKLFEE